MSFRKGHLACIVTTMFLAYHDGKQLPPVKNTVTVTAGMLP